MDWTELWYNEIKGETKLLICPNAEHSTITGIPEVIESICSFVESIAIGHTEKDRPSFDYTYDAKTGEIMVNITGGILPDKVAMRYAQTM
jgi:PhoPQ-activated pathogenicity-related protein